MGACCSTGRLIESLMRLILLLVLLATAASSNLIYVIRHGEKTSAVGCLNAQGKERAAALPGVFNGTAFLVPKALFANYYDDPLDCERCLETLQPMSAHLNLTIDHSHGYPFWIGGNKGAAKAMLASLQATGGPVMTAWEHVNIQYLVEDLGVAKTSVPDWQSTDFDTVYVLSFYDNQTLASFHVEHENIHPAASPSALPTDVHYS